MFNADATQPATQEALASLALDKSKRATLRYSALRKLEEQAPPSSVPVAEKLAEDRTRTADSDFLRANAVGVLFRSKTDEGKAALARATSSNLDNAVLAARMKQGA